MMKPWLTMTLLVLVGCESTGVGNPGLAGTTGGQTTVGSGDVDLDVTALALTADEGEGPRADEFLPPGSVQAAVVSIDNITVVPCDEGEAIQRLAGPFEVDLEDPGSFVLPDVQNTTSGVCSLVLRMRPASADARYPGEWLHVEGNYDGSPFSISLVERFTLEVRTKKDTAWGLSGADVARSVILAMRPERWLTRSEVARRAHPSGALVVDARTPVLVGLVRLRLRATSTLHEDRNGDRLLDAAERLAEAILGNADQPASEP